MTEFCNFKIDVIKWKLDFVLHKFSLNILMVLNQTCTERLFDFEITPMIADQIALCSV